VLKKEEKNRKIIAAGQSPRQAPLAFDKFLGSTYNGVRIWAPPAGTEKVVEAGDGRC
jgi:hypothetical protein